MTLEYEIKFYDYWHLSSGLSAGAKLDSSVVKDDDGLPYVPAKTTKGLTREIAEILFENDSLILNCFGDEGVRNGKCYFANATIENNIKEEIISNKLQNNLYDTLSFTTIGADGIAVDDSLREIEVVIPLSLIGKILDIPSKEDFEKLKTALKSIKRMGLNRNRGLGRCEFQNIQLVEDIK